VTRVPELVREQLSDDQLGLYDLVAKQRGRVRGPFRVLLHTPELGTPIAHMVDHFHAETRLPMRLKEFAILLIARHFTAQYAWLVHEPRAHKAGLGQDVIRAIREGRPVVTHDDQLEAAYAVTMDILDTDHLSERAYTAAKQVLDDPAMVELVVLIGFYISIAVLLRAFDVDIPEGGAPPLVP
jgi:4-carboxymuconolactone decarboxylase